MRIIPVLDLMGGVVVRAVAGRRSEYRPIHSPLVDSPDPSHVAQRLLEASGATELYVADLDAITRGESVTDAVREFLNAVGVRVWFDGGFRTAEAASTFAPPIRPVLASEIVGVPVRDYNCSAYSIDLRNGAAVSATNATPLELAASAVAVGFETLIVLDLANVGTDTGPGTLPLVRELRTRYPRLELISGGGVRDHDDLARLADAGADAALVASALHAGRMRKM